MKHMLIWFYPYSTIIPLKNYVELNYYGLYYHLCSTLPPFSSLYPENIFYFKHFYRSASFDFIYVECITMFCIVNTVVLMCVCV